MYLRIDVMAIKKKKPKAAAVVGPENKNPETTERAEIPVWERKTSFAAMFLVLGVIILLIFKDEPFRNPITVGLVWTLLSLAGATWGATIPGMFSIQYVYQSKPKTKLAIRAGGAICFFLIIFFGIRLFLSDKLPVVFTDDHLPLSSVSNDLSSISANSNVLEDIRLVDQRQFWKQQIQAGMLQSNTNLLVVRANFSKAYLPFKLRLTFGNGPKGNLNNIVELGKGFAAIVDKHDMIRSQLDFVVEINGQGHNPNNDNYIDVFNADPSGSLLVITTISPRPGKDADFKARDWMKKEITRLVNPSSVSDKDAVTPMTSSSSTEA
jgi:hypothetical protein